MTHFQYRNDVLSLDLCVSQSFGDKSVSLTDAASWSLIKSAHRAIWNVYQALFMLFTSTTAESPIMENLFSVRIFTNPEHSINYSWITNKDCTAQYEFVQRWENIEKNFLGDKTGVLCLEHILADDWYQREFDQDLSLQTILIASNDLAH